MASTSYEITSENFHPFYKAFREKFISFAYPDGLPIVKNAKGKDVRMKKTDQKVWFKLENNKLVVSEILGNSGLSASYLWKLSGDLPEKKPTAKDTVNAIEFNHAMKFLGYSFPDNSDLSDPSLCDGALEWFKNRSKALPVQSSNLDAVNKARSAESLYTVEDYDPSFLMELSESELALLSYSYDTSLIKLNKPIEEATKDAEKFWHLIQRKKFESAWSLVAENFGDPYPNSRNELIQSFSIDRGLWDLCIFNVYYKAQVHVFCKVFYKCDQGFPELRDLVYSNRQFFEHGIAVLRLFLIGVGVKIFDPTNEEVRSAKTLQDLFVTLGNRATDNDKVIYEWLSNQRTQFVASVLQNCVYKYAEENLMLVKMELCSIRFAVLYDEYGDSARGRFFARNINPVFSGKNRETKS